MAFPGSHHRADGRFQNPWPNATPPGFRDLLRWRLDRLLRPPPAGADPATFPRATPRFGLARSNGAVAVTWIGHSTGIIEVGGKTILTDPV
ncbi:MAG: hypothetical protein ABI647_13565 [Gemmatimonadota bacterium]